MAGLGRSDTRRAIRARRQPPHRSAPPRRWTRMERRCRAALPLRCLTPQAITEPACLVSGMTATFAVDGRRRGGHSSGRRRTTARRDIVMPAPADPSSRFGRLVDFARREPGRCLATVLAAHVVVWTALPALLSYNLQLDLAEGLALGREWQLGYRSEERRVGKECR